MYHCELADFPEKEFTFQLTHSPTKLKKSFFQADDEISMQEWYSIFLFFKKDFLIMVLYSILYFDLGALLSSNKRWSSRMPSIR